MPDCTNIKCNFFIRIIIYNIYIIFLALTLDKIFDIRQQHFMF